MLDRKELDYFHSKGVWDMRRIQEAWSKTGRPPISVRWVDVNRGDDEYPSYRSRLVAREIRMAGEGKYKTPSQAYNNSSESSGYFEIRSMKQFPSNHADPLF